MHANFWRHAERGEVEVANSPSVKERAWPVFDAIVDRAAPNGVHTNPWVRDGTALRYCPDFEVLRQLLGVPLYLSAGSQTGVPALALDVWMSYELRRAGFDGNATWPRASHPRIVPTPVAAFIDSLPAKDRVTMWDRLQKKQAVKGVSMASASILGKNYFKQVDVIMSDWNTGPELLVSTKRMDSSYGKNAANRVEESYGDAKNLRLRHPLAALGFVFGLRSDILDSSPSTAEWLMDLLEKLGREDDAYHATCLVMFDYAADLVVVGEGAEIDDDLEEAGIEVVDVSGAETEVVRVLAALPLVQIRHDVIPEALTAERFLQVMVDRVLDATPVDRHVEARRRRRVAVAVDD
jgi:hypothetical protein